MNSFMQKAQDIMGMNRHSQYVYTDYAVLRSCVASVPVSDLYWTAQLDGVRHCYCSKKFWISAWMFSVIGRLITDSSVQKV